MGFHVATAEICAETSSSPLRTPRARTLSSSAGRGEHPSSTPAASQRPRPRGVSARGAHAHGPGPAGTRFRRGFRHAVPPHLRRKAVRGLVRHGPANARVGASGEPGVVQFRTALGVGGVVARSVRAAIDEPARFRHSASVGACFGRTRWLSMRGDKGVRTHLYQGANAILTRINRPPALQASGLGTAKRSGSRRRRWPSPGSSQSSFIACGGTAPSPAGPVPRSPAPDPDAAVGGRWKLSPPGRERGLRPTPGWPARQRNQRRTSHLSAQTHTRP